MPARKPARPVLDDLDLLSRASIAELLRLALRGCSHLAKILDYHIGPMAGLDRPTKQTISSLKALLGELTDFCDDDKATLDKVKQVLDRRRPQER
jgi:hypothetical protein